MQRRGAETAVIRPKRRKERGGRGAQVVGNTGAFRAQYCCGGADRRERGRRDLTADLPGLEKPEVAVWFQEQNENTVSGAPSLST